MVREIGKISEKPGDSRWYMFDSGKHTQVLVVRTLCQMDYLPPSVVIAENSNVAMASGSYLVSRLSIVGPTDASLNLAKHRCNG